MFDLEINFINELGQGETKNFKNVFKAVDIDKFFGLISFCTSNSEGDGEVFTLTAKNLVSYEYSKVKY